MQFDAIDQARSAAPDEEPTVKSAAEFADMSDPDRNLWFRRRWSDGPMTPRELEHAAEIELAHGNRCRAELLSWRAHVARVGSGSRA